MRDRLVQRWLDAGEALLADGEGPSTFFEVLGHVEAIVADRRIIVSGLGLDEGADASDLFVLKPLGRASA